MCSQLLKLTELVAISGSLALLTNIVLAWTTHQLQNVLDDWAQDNRSVAPEILRHIAPAHFRSINFRGQLHFPIAQNASYLIAGYGKTPSER